MAVAVQTSTTTNWSVITYTGGLCTFTMNKPTGVVVGDLLLAQVANDGLAGTYNMPCGWTQLIDSKNGSIIRSTIFYKIATSTEVAASTFTWTINTGTNSAMGGAILRIDGHSPGNPIWTSAADTTVVNTAAPSFNNTITPAVANSLLLLIATAQQNGNNIGGYAIVTSNPT